MSETKSKKSLTIKDGTAETGQALKQERTKHSLFMLTVNTNQSFDDPGAPEFKRAKKEFTEALLSRINYDSIYDYLKFMSGSKKDVLDVDLDAALERGDRQKFLHAHIMIHVTHKAKLQIDIAKFRSEVNKELGRTCYMNVRTQSAGVANLKDYIAKGLKGADKLDFGSLDPLHIKKAGTEQATKAGSSGNKDPRLLDLVSGKMESMDHVIGRAMKDPKLAKALDSKFQHLSDTEDKLTMLLNDKGPDSIAMKTAAKEFLREKMAFVDAIDEARTGNKYGAAPVGAFKTLFKKWFADYIGG